MPSNTAAFLVGTGKPLEIRSAPYPEPAEHEIVIKSHSIALNPCDWGMQMLDAKIFPWLKFPTIIGEDVAGEVAAVGSAVTRFKVGDRVTGRTDAAFQQFPVVLDHIAAKIPDSLSFEQASVIPLALTTAVVGLFHKDWLALDLPSFNVTPKGQIVLITGGATSVGSNAIQLAVAAGYEVYSTASRKNFEYTKNLGATQVFDYSSPTIKEDLAAALKGKSLAGAIANGGSDASAFEGIVETCAAAVVSAVGRKFVALTMVPPANLPPNVETSFINCMVFSEEQDLGRKIYGEFLPKALADGTFVAAPPARVVATGLDGIQLGLDKMTGERSATKFVVAI